MYVLSVNIGLYNLQECPSSKQFPLSSQQKTNSIMIDNLLQVYITLMIIMVV